MKRNLKLFSLLSFFLLSLVVTWCNDNQEMNDNKKDDSITLLPNNEVVDILKWFADNVGVDYSNIKEDNFDWYNYSENDYELPDVVGWYYNLTWYSINVTWIKDLPKTNKIFDWRYVFYIWDEIWAAAIEYAKDNVLCYYYQSLEQEIPYELMVWEWDFDEEGMENYDKAWKDFQETATYSIDLYCGYLPEWIIHTKDFYFDAEWQEPFWNASLRWSLINVFTPSWMDEEYISTLKMDWDDIIFKWYNVNWKLEKTECVDGWKWDTHEYKISFDIIKSIYWEDGALTDDKEITKFEWCADKINSEFIKWEEWTMKNFIDKAHYNYSRNFDLDDVYYTIWDIAGRYINVFVYETDWDSYDSYQIILENVDGRYNVLYEWDWYEISEEECEELNQYDNNLMDMFFLRSCPRG